MIRNLTSVGLTLVAILAMSAVGASAVQASAPEFHAEEAPATYEGEQVGSSSLTLNTGVVKCAKGTLAGTSSTTTTTELVLEATYSECVALGLAATWHMNGCTYPNRMVLGSSPPTSLTDIVCPAGKEITITIGKLCVVHVPPQKGIKHVVWDMEGAGKTRDLKATTTEENITYTETSGCVNPGTWTTGVYNAVHTIKGKNNKGTQQGIWAE